MSKSLLIISSTCLVAACIATTTTTKPDCVPTYHTGCQTASDCCSEHMMCMHFAGQNSGMCRPWLKQTEDCSPMGHDCRVPEDCCGTHNGSRFELTCMGGKCRHWLVQSLFPKVTPEVKDCIPFMGQGCKSSTDCCGTHTGSRTELVCVAGRCKHWL